MSFYDRMAATALSKITKFGQAVTVRTKVDDAYDSQTGEVLQTETSESGFGMLMASTSSVKMEAEINPIPAKVDDLRTWILAAAGLANAPEPGDVLEGGGAAWSIIGVTEVSPAGIPLIYKLLAKKARAI